MTLYEIATQYSSLKAFIEDHNDQAEVDPDYLLHLLKQIEGDLYDKVDQIARYILSLLADCNAVKTEQERLTSRRQALERKAGWLKDYLVGELTSANVDKIERPLLTIALRKKPASIQIVDQALIPEMFKHQETTESVDKKAIMDTYKKNGEIVPGTEVITGGKYLHIG